MSRINVQLSTCVGIGVSLGCVDKREACRWFCAASHERQRAWMEHARGSSGCLEDAKDEINFRYRRQPAASH